jgi:exodeoxyribonuclease VII large subunit
MHGDRKVFSVASFNEGIGIYLGRLPSVWIEGEITELRRNDGWAFVFFTLRDPTSAASLGVTMQRRRFDALDLHLVEGEQVLVEGKPEIYAAKGGLSFRASTIERIGLGDHLAAIERLKRALASEGLFAPERKRPLPAFPRAVGIVTGADAAARGDLVTGIRTRFPPARIVVAETRVQGTGAAPAIAASLRAVARHDDVDVIVVTRGGGSFEDLLPFSDERVVRAFAACPVPIVSAVGHEQDTPLCDLAADARASTPTAAARLVVPDLADLERGLGRLRANLTVLVRRSLGREHERLARQRDRLHAAPLLVLERRRAALDNAAVRLQALSPRSTLDRGYAIVRARGAALRNSTDAGAGERLEIELSVGALSAIVIEERP